MRPTAAVVVAIHRTSARSTGLILNQRQGLGIRVTESVILRLMTHLRTVARRDALKQLAMGAVGTAAVPGWVEELAARALDHGHGQTGQAKSGPWRPRALTGHQNATVIVISELIIPQTDTAGAEAAQVNQFIDAVIADADPETRGKFFQGLSWVDERSHRLYAADFIAATPEQQTAILMRMEPPVTDSPKPGAAKEPYTATAPQQRDRNEAPVEEIALDFFRAMKSLTITGYYTSEIGMGEELGDDGTMVFEDYPGCGHASHKS